MIYSRSLPLNSGPFYFPPSLTFFFLRSNLLSVNAYSFSFFPMFFSLFNWSSTVFLLLTASFLNYIFFRYICFLCYFSFIVHPILYYKLSVVKLIFCRGVFGRNLFKRFTVLYKTSRSTERATVCSYMTSKLQLNSHKQEYS